MVSRPLCAALTGVATVLVASCALVLGFEDHEPFPPSAGGATATGGGGSGASGGGTGATGGGSAGAGGQGGTGVAVLLIPDASVEAIGIYDLDNGAYLGDFLPPATGSEPFEFETPNNAIQGPDGRIYVSDQLTDAIVRFEIDGTFESVLADETDGLDNVRGMDFRGDVLFASVSPGSGAAFVARFDLTGTRLSDFVADDSDPFDVLFLAGGTMLLANVNDPDHVREYDIDGSSYNEIITIDFPQQLHLLPGGNVVVAAWTEVTEFRIDGAAVRSIPGLSACSGVYPLGNGQWLISSDDGVRAYDPDTGQVAQPIRVGGAFMKIERVTLPELP